LLKGYYQNYYRNNGDQRQNPIPQSYDDGSITDKDKNNDNDYGNDYETQNFDYSDIANSQSFDPFKFVGDGVGDNLDYNSFTDFNRA
jgi:hypothetical protein